MQQIKVIAFDADDTLWDNQVFYDKVESEFCHLLAGYGTAEEISSRLFAIEMENMDIYKYGAKPFTLSMVEAAVKISRNRWIRNVNCNVRESPIILIIRRS